MRISDITALAEIAKAKKILFAVDNSLLTPFLQRPLELGADFACQSVTKYINGHSDINMGSLSMNRDDLLGDMTVSQTSKHLSTSFFWKFFLCFHIVSSFLPDNSLIRFRN